MLRMIGSDKLYQVIIETSRDAFFAIDLTGKFIEVNAAACKMYGYSRRELLQLHIDDIEANEDEDQIKAQIKRIIEKGSTLFERIHRCKNGQLLHVEISASIIPQEDKAFFAFVRDISERKRANQLARLRTELAEFEPNEDYQQLMTLAIDRAEVLTQSEIGFFHFVEDNEDAIALQVWSTRTLHEMCFAKGKTGHYPVCKAGVWVDCIHERRPVIHNDYASLPHKKGLPKGHTKLYRELTTPVFREGKVVAVMGVGNKTSDYLLSDQELVSEIADMAFDFVERAKAQSHIQYMAFYDLLTGLPNRALLLDRTFQAISRCKRNSELLGIGYLDLDGFKPVNDRYGHAMGDKLLVQLSQRLVTELRSGDTLSRLGGDEFVVLLTGLPSMKAGEEVIDRLLERISQPFEIDNHRIHISGSMGLTFFPIDEASADQLLRHADLAMYRAKGQGKSGYALYDLIESRKESESQRTLAEIESALNLGELQLYYQPKMELINGKISGFEALLRWHHPQKGVLLPGTFLPYIAGSPLELRVGEWVIHEAIKQHMQWRDQGLRFPISVNIPPRQLQHQGFFRFLGNLLSHYPADVPAFLELEILESGLVSQPKLLAERMRQGMALGIRFSLDDFGTGYASLSHFHQLPVDIVKIDRAFVMSMLDNADDLYIVESVIRLARGLDRPTVAEGVETIETALLLLLLGCHCIQGFGIARPLPAAKVEPWLADWSKNEIWQNLASFQIDRKLPPDLSIALISHEIWLRQLSHYLESNFSAPPPNMNEEECPFGRWYFGIGRTRYGNRESYAFIQFHHHQVHECAKVLIAKAKDGLPVTQEATHLHQVGQGLTDSLLALLA